jgi:hypothetical protein
MSVSGHCGRECEAWRAEKQLPISSLKPSFLSFYLFGNAQLSWDAAGDVDAAAALSDLQSQA